MNDDDVDLPRVFFCSVTWAAQRGLQLPLQGECVGSMRDHDFAIVKRRRASADGGLNFQLLQGYSDSVDFHDACDGEPGSGGCRLVLVMFLGAGSSRQSTYAFLMGLLAPRRAERQRRGPGHAYRRQRPSRLRLRSR